MIKIYSDKFRTLLTILFLLCCVGVSAQTTIVTDLPSSYLYNSTTADGAIVFGVKNSNPSPVTITTIGNYIQENFSATYKLWYHTTNVTGAPTAISAANGWVNSATATYTSTTAGINQSLFSGLAIVIPANTTYRFAISGPPNAPFYAPAYTNSNSFTTGGVEVCTQDNSNSPGYGGGFPGAPANTPRGFIGSVTFNVNSSSVANNASAAFITSPNNFCAGTHDLKVKVLNLGNNILNSVRVNWQVDGLLQTPVDYTTPINVSGGAGGNEAIVTLGSLVFDKSAKTIKAWTSLPNNTTDPISSDDTTTAVLRARLNGTYSIGPASNTDFQTLTSAVSALSSGICGPVTFDIASGTYNEQIVIPFIPGTSATNRVKFKGNLATLAFSSGATGARAGITLLGADFITIDSLQIDGTAGLYGWGVLLTGAADRNTISNCVINVSSTSITSANHIGIVTSNSLTTQASSGNSSNFTTITANTITGGYYGISLYGNTTAGSQTSGNVISKNIIKDFYSYAINVLGQNGAVIDSNDISRPSRTSSIATAGVFLSTGNISCKIVRNRIHNMFDGQTSSTSLFYGVYSSADGAVGQENKFINNAIYDIKGLGTQYGLYNTIAPYTQYYHNTVVFSDQSAASGATYGMYQTGAAAGVDYRNNIIYLTRTGTGTKRAVYFVTTTSGITSNNNVYYFNPTGGTASFFGQFGTTNYSSLADWRAANTNAFDQQSLQTDPLITNLASGNLTPSEASINGIGANLGVTNDILNNPRSSSPDPGAYEFSLAGLDAAITWVSPVNPVTTGSKIITVNINNTQSTTITSLNLSYTDGSTITSQTFTGLNIAGGGSQQLAFTTPYNLIQSAVLRAYISQVNGIKDNSQLNDTTALQPLCIRLSGTYTINPLQPGINGNYQSFSAAVLQLVCSGVSGPVTFNFAAGSGPYNEQVTIPSINGVSASNTITFNGNDVILQATAVTANRDFIKLDGADYITIKKLNIIAQGTDYGWGIHLMNGADHNTIDSCNIDLTALTSTTSDNTAGIVCSNSLTDFNADGSASFNTFSNNNIRGGYQGIVFNGAATAINATSNVFTKNNIQDFYSNGIELTDNNGAVISFNNIHRPNRTAVTTFEGIEMGTGNKSCLINSNRIHDTHNTATSQSGAAYGIYSTLNDAPAGSENRVINNLIYNFNSVTGIQYGIYNSGSDSTLYYHNSVILDNASSTSGTTRGIYQTTAATGIDVKNNVVYVTRGGSGTKHALYYGTTTSDIKSNKNLLYINTPAATTSGIGSFGTINYQTLLGWQAANNNAYDQQSIETDPVFVASTSFDYIPTAPSANNIGDNVGVTQDILGISRGTNPDPGAYEFSLSGCVNPPTAGTVTASSNPVCSGTNFTLDIAGNSIGDGQTYQWQISTDSTNWTPLGNAQTGTAYTTSQIVNRYYRVGVSCNGGITVYSPGLLITTPAAVSGTFTINNAQPTSGTNFQTFTAAVNHIRCTINGPVVFNVVAGSGPYNEQVMINDINGTSSTNTITINGNGTTINFLSTNSNDRAGIKLNGTDYVTINNLVINSTGTLVTEYGYGIQLTNNADHNTIQGCTINVTATPATASSTAYAGIVLNSISSTTPVATGNSLCDSNLIVNNTITGGYAGITSVANGTSNNITGNMMINNRISDFYIYGIYLNGNLQCVVEANDISRPNRTSVSTFYGVYLSTGNVGAKVSRNKIHDSFNGNLPSTAASYGIYTSSSDGTAGNENVFSNNMIYKFNNAGTQYGIYNSGSSFCEYYYNSILLDGPATSSVTYDTRGFYQTTLATNLVYKNNIVFLYRQGIGENHCMYFVTSTTTFVSDYNDLQITSTSGTFNNVAYFNAVQYPTVAAWFAATGKDEHSLSVDPLFTSANDLHLQQGSPVNDKGITVPVTVDFDGEARSTTPDIGADEKIINYTFIGNGNFSDAANWAGGIVPPSPLPADNEIVINPSGGVAVLNIPFTLNGGKIIIRSGKNLVIQGNLTITQ